MFRILLNTEEHRTEWSFALLEKPEQQVRTNEGAFSQPAETVLPPLLMADFSHSSSKFAAVGFHRALTAELDALGKTGIKTSCLCPVFVNTGFTKNPSTR